MGTARQFAACYQAGSCRVVNADGPAGRDERIGNERARGRAAWPLVQVARRAVSDGRGARIHWHASSLSQVSRPGCSSHAAVSIGAQVAGGRAATKGGLASARLALRFQDVCRLL